LLLKWKMPHLLCPAQSLLNSPPTRKPDGTRLRGNEKTVAKKQALSARALADLDRWIADHLRVPAAA
jgi:methylenetetrahydrofolate--tRNA-(uracil-5-)-methyltransferase